MGSSMVSMPHYLSHGVNELTASAVEEAVKGLRTTLMLTMTGVEEIILFFIKMMYSTYICLITLAVRSSVHVATDLVEEAADSMNKTIKSIGNDVNHTVNNFEEDFNKFVDFVNSAASDAGSKVPKLDLSKQLNSLQKVELPSSIDKSLSKINNSLPNFDQVMNFTDSVLSTPFEEVKKLINQSMGNYSFDRSALPVPAKKNLAFCDDDNGIDGFFDGASDMIKTARKIFIAILVIVAVLICAFMAWQEIRRWRHMKERSQLVRKEAHDPMDVVYIVSRPFTAGTGIKAASNFSNSRRQTLVRWFIAYVTTVPALFVLSLGIAGLLACFCQYLLLRGMQHAVPELTSQVDAYADKVVDSLQNTSASWANDANAVIKHTNNDLNHQVFGWVNTSTGAVNGTLNTFVDNATNVLNYTFNGTPLYEPVQGVFDCIIGLKVMGMEKGLTWVSDHAHINFPLLPNDTFSRGAATSANGSTSDSFLSEKGDETSNKISAVVTRVVNKFEKSIQTEAIIAGTVVLIWVFIVLLGLLRALCLFWTREKTRGEGGGPPLYAPESRNNIEAYNYRPDSHGFFNVPLNNLPNHNNAGDGHVKDAAPPQPAPRYESVSPTTTLAPRGGGNDDGGLPAGESQYQDEKLGFAGQRDYEAALNAHHGPMGLRSSISAEYGDEKI